MADSSDVEAALAAAIGACLAGTVFAGTRVYRGLPQPALLDADFAVGITHVTVAAMNEARDTSRYIARKATEQVYAATLTGVLSAGRARFGGTGGAGQVAGVLVNGVAYAYRLADADGPADVANGLSRQIPLAGTDGADLLADGLQAVRIVADARCLQEVRREARQFRVAFWCPSPEIRDGVVAVVDPVLSGMPFLSIQDGSCGRMVAVAGSSSDRADGAGLWRRDLIFEVEYAVSLEAVLPRMLFGTTVAAVNGAVLLQMGDEVVPASVAVDGQGDVLTDAAGHVLGEIV